MPYSYFLIVAELMPESCPSVSCDMPRKFRKCLIFSPVELAEQIKDEKPEVTTEEIRELQTSYEDMLKAILWVLDGAKYLWQGNAKGEEKSPDSGNC